MPIYCPVNVRVAIPPSFEHHLGYIQTGAGKGEAACTKCGERRPLSAVPWTVPVRA